MARSDCSMSVAVWNGLRKRMRLARSTSPELRLLRDDDVHEALEPQQSLRSI